MSGPSVSRHHADWLSLIEVSGPFVSLPVLMRIFPQGLEPRDPAQAKALRAAYEEWQDNPAVPGSQRAWVIHVLSEVLGYAREQIAEGQLLPAGPAAKMPEMGETLRPDFALVGPAGSDTAGQAQLLMTSYPAGQDLDKPVIDKHWKATPATRMMELLHGTGVPLGLVTNGEQWTLVYAPRGETTGYAAWYGSLWLDEPITLRAFHSLLGVRRFFGVAADSSLFAMLKESASDQQEVTDQLGYQVREAVEVLVKSVDSLDRENGRALLKDLSETVLYDAALTIMMRLVFLFAAEERGLLHLGKPLYDDNYAVSTLQEQLQNTADQHGEEVLERRFDAWMRLLSTFRAVHGGIQHQDLLMLAYGGSLFDPDRYPFLEGRAPQSSWRTSAAGPLAVNNRIVLHLLNSLQRLQVRVPGGGPSESRRISFRALGVEQIGHVYEGLLDRTAVRASEPIIGIKGARHKEREFPIAALESLLVQGREKLIEFLKDETGRSSSALRHALADPISADEHRLLIACGQDKRLLERIRPFANLIREDSFGHPLVTLTGNIYVTMVTARRSTGTHYTPPSLTEPIVQLTMEPLVYEGPAEGLPREQWQLKSPNAILDLKICDMAMGSGAFLVQACRFMSERLVEAWETLEKQHPAEVLITPEGTFSTGSTSERLVPADTNERIAIARRIVADRCLYGVDINPMAVEMAKLSIWLITLQRNRPFSFLDHALKCGDSLVGIDSMIQIENFSLRPNVRQTTFATAAMSELVEDASIKRRALGHLPSNDIGQINFKNRLHAESETTTARIKALADCLIALEFHELDGRAYDNQRAVAAAAAEEAMKRTLLEFQSYARALLHGRRPFHWCVEFPEVFADDGFDAVVGNPPFLGGTRISSANGVDYVKLLKRINPEAGDRTDLVAYFFRRTLTCLSNHGTFGLIGTNTIAETDTARAGLRHLCQNRVKIYRADSERPWPGQAGLSVSVVHGTRGDWRAAPILDGEPATNISSLLTDAEESEAPKEMDQPFVAGNGAKPNSEGFLLTEGEASELISHDSSNSAVVKPYLAGDDVISKPAAKPERWAIYFGDVPLASAEQFAEPLQIVRERVYPERSVATDRVKREKWWQFERHAKEVLSATSQCAFCFAAPYTSKYLILVRVEKDVLVSDGCIAFATDDWPHFAVLQSTVHEIWARRPGMSKLETRPRYNPALCFRTYPLPTSNTDLARVGSEYHEYRLQIMKTRHEGLTDIYNRFHSPEDNSPDIERLRVLRVGLDQMVVGAYAWNGLDLGYGFHETKQGVRYTISDLGRRIVLDRLLALNHYRHAEQEVKKAAMAASAPVKRARQKKARADKLTLDLL